MGRDFTADARLWLLMLMADGVEASGRALVAAWHRSTRPGRLEAQLRRLEQAKIVQHNGTGSMDERLFRLTAHGRQWLIGEVDPEARWSRRWDGSWRLVMFDVPQAQSAVRARLRRKLAALRFGWLQNSVWLSPDPVDELLQEVAGDKASVDSLVFFEGRPAGGESDADLIAAAWDWSRLGKAYAAYRKILRLHPTSGRAAKATEWRHWLEGEQRAWNEIAQLDPFLPETLWPADYPGRSVWQQRLETLRDAGRLLSEAAAKAE